MSFRFYRRLHVARWLRVNLSQSGPSLSFGVRGAHLTIGRRGVTRTIGLPGTGIFWTSGAGRHSGYHSARGWTPESTPEEQAAADRDVERAIGIVVLMVIAAVLGWWLVQ